jgi:tRNA G10  N-methylase Trm11
MEYLIRFAQTHETFRQPEIQALAWLHDIDLEIVSYNELVSPHFLLFFPVPLPKPDGLCWVAIHPALPKGRT